MTLPFSTLVELADLPLRWRCDATTTDASFAYAPLSGANTTHYQTVSNQELDRIDPRLLPALHYYTQDDTGVGAGILLRAAAAFWTTAAQIVLPNTLTPHPTYLWKASLIENNPADAGALVFTAHAMVVDTQRQPVLPIEVCNIRVNASFAWLDHHFPGASDRLCVARGLDLPLSEQTAFTFYGGSSVSSTPLPAQVSI